MDTRVFCVYNLATRVFLSSKVTVANGENQPLKVLKVMVSGLALDAESGLWLNPLKSTPAVPRLFPFDLVYLDHDHRIVEMVEVLADVEFPPYRREVASAIVLPLDTLRSTQSRRGDQLVVCLRAEADQLIPAPSVQANMHSTQEGLVPRSLAQIEEPATATAREASEVVPIIEDQRTASARDIVASYFAVEETPQIEAGEVDEAQQLDSVGGLTASTSSAHQQEATWTSEEHPPNTLASTPVRVSIPEVEKPRTPATTPVIEDGDEVEDLFANWVESPYSTSALIGRRERPSAMEVDAAAQKALTSTALTQSQAVSGQETKSATTSPPKIEVIAGEKTETVSKVERPAEAESIPASETLQPAPTPELTAQPPKADSDAAPEAAEPAAGQAAQARQAEPSSPQASANQPVKLAIPQPRGPASFTVAQYGMWQVSAPTALTSRVAPPMKPGVEGAADRVSEKADAKEASMKKEASSQHAVTNSTASEAASKPIQKDPVPGPIAEADHTALEESDLRVSEPATGLAGQVAAPVTDRLKDFESRLANALTNASAGWSRDSSGETGPETAPQLVRSQEPEANAESDWRTERIVEATGKPAPAEFAALVQEKLDRLQVRADEGPVESPALISTPVIQKVAEKAKVVSEDAAGVMAKRAEPADDPLKSRPVRLSARLRSWLTPAPQLASDRRRAHRRYVPGMVAHYFTGGAPKPYDVADISLTGFYVLTEDRWTPDTMVRMTLQKPCVKGGKKQSITVLSRIVRRGSDGVAAEFVMPDSLDPQSRDVMPSEATDRIALARFL
jgi:hypothetical protein